MDAQVSPGKLEEVFGLVANQSRIDVLLELWKQYPDPIAFSDLREAVGMENSGKFNYHLNVLRPEFVRKGEEGYRLTFAGRQAIGVSVSGSFTAADTVDIGRVPAGTCRICTGRLEAVYEEGHVVVTCSDCEELLAKLPISPISISTVEPERVPDVFSDHLLILAHTLSSGFCTHCRGRVEASLTALSDEESVTYRDTLDVRFDCQQCGDWTNLNVGGVLMNHPVVTSFLFDAGIDLHDRGTYGWEVLPLHDPDENLAGGEDPRLELRFEIDERVLELTVDDSVTVVDYEHP